MTNNNTSIRDILSVSLSQKEMSEINLLYEVFSENDINSICEQVLKFIDDFDFDGSLSISEKCMLVLTEINLPPRYSDPLQAAIEETQDMSIDNLVKVINSPQNAGKFEFENVISKQNWPIFCNPTYLQALCTQLNLDPEKTDELFSISDDLIKNGTTDREFPSFLIEKPEIYITALQYNSAVALIESYEMPEIDKKELRLNTIASFKASKDVVAKIKSKYDLWESCVNDFSPLYTYLGIIASRDDDNCYNEFIFVRTLLTYHILYSHNWKRAIFNEMLSNCCNDSLRKLAFIQGLSKHQFVDDFCIEYRRYIDENNIPPLFDMSIVKPKLILTQDEDKDHKDWFAPIPEDRYKHYSGDNATQKSNEELYNCLKRLYQALSARRMIDPNIPLELFIYRFSGFMTPQEPILKFIQPQNVNLGFMCYLIMLLFKVDSGKPPYSKINKFFEPGFSNISKQSEEANRKDKIEVRKLLEVCGFTNLYKDGK